MQKIILFLLMLPSFAVAQFRYNTPLLQWEIRASPGVGTFSPIWVNGRTKSITFPADTLKRKIVLYDIGGDNFFGFGINPGALRYQVSGVSSSHVFFVSTSPTTSTELMRISGNGRAGINQPNPAARLDVVYVAGESGVKISNGGGAGSGETFFPFTDGKNYIRGVTVIADESALQLVGIGTAAPTSKLHVNGAAGHNQFREEKPYTPTGTGDANGLIGQKGWDDNYEYRKTSAGWKRAALSTF